MPDVLPYERGAIDRVRPHLLLETADTPLARRWAGQLRRSGFEVTRCHGARPGSSCPLLCGRPCPLVDQAAVVLHALTRPPGQSVLQRLRAARKPVLALNSGDGPGVVLTRDQLVEEVRRTYASRARRLSLTVPLSNARTVRIQAIRPRDAELLRAFDTGLSESSRRFRFLGWMAPISEERASALATVDFRDRFSLVALAGTGRRRSIVGECRLVPIPEEKVSSEIAIAVADEFQGAGLGRWLLRLMMGVAADRGVTRMVAEVRYDNVRMMHLLRELGFELVCWELGVVTFKASPARTRWATSLGTGAS